MSTVFSTQDFADVADLAIDAWSRGIGGDWSAPAGTLEWTCRRTAEHTLDAVLAPALFLASRRVDAYPPLRELAVDDDGASPADLVDCLRAVTNVVVAVLDTTDASVRAIIRRRPAPATAGPVDFAPRCGLELILHTHDICAGLGVGFDPPPGHCRRLLEHTHGWPSERPLPATDDAWSDLLASRGRPRVR